MGNEKEYKLFIDGKEFDLGTYEVKFNLEENDRSLNLPNETTVTFDDVGVVKEVFDKSRKELKGLEMLLLLALRQVYALEQTDVT